MNSKLSYWLAALYLPDVGPHLFMRWLECFSDIEQLFCASRDALRDIGVSEKHIRALQHPYWKAVEDDLMWGQQNDHHVLTFEDERYPHRLKEIADPPLVLYVRGNCSLLSAVQLAIVGSRHPSSEGVKNAEQFAAFLSEAGLVITSGLALGIDGASHRATLKAKGMTIGVSGTGLNHCYPLSHQSLVDDILAQEGAVISEFPLSTLPQAKNFPRRNRIISGLSVGVLVIEAALKSGSLTTARHALDQNRDVFAIPGSIHQALARGCHHLIRQGAKLVETATDILDELGGCLMTHPSPLKKAAKQDPLAPEHRQLFEHIGHEITPMDMIILRSGLTPSEVSSILLILELQGYVRSVPGGYVRTTAC